MRGLGRMLVWIFVAAAIAFAGFAVYVRLAPDDPARWHKDPEFAEERGLQNDFIVGLDRDDADMASPVYERSPEKLMADFRAAILATPRTEVLSEADGFVTYVQRSRLMAFPDYISVKAAAVEGGSALYVYSRSRYGQSDLGVNAARVSALLNEL